METPRPLNKREQAEKRKRSEKREQAEGISLPDFSLCEVANSPKKCGIGPKTGTQSTGTEQKPKITLQAGGQLTRRKGAKNTHQGKGSPLNKPCHTPKNTVLRLHHRQKASFPPQALSLLGPLKADTLGSQSHTRTFLPTFPHLFLPLPPGRSRGDRAPVHVNWTPQAPKAESPVGPEESRLPPAWTHPQAVLKPRLSARTQTPAFHKPKPQQVLRRWGSRQLRAELHLWAQCTFPPWFREVSSAFPDSQWESADTASLTGQALPRGWFYSKW